MKEEQNKDLQEIQKEIPNVKRKEKPIPRPKQENLTTKKK